MIVRGVLSPYFKILRKRNFFLLWLGQLISQFGDRLTQMALIGLVYQISPYSSVSLAKIMSLAIVPVFLLSPVAGVCVDRWDKKKMMYMSDFWRGVFILAIPVVFFHLKTIAVVYMLIFLSFCVGRFFIPAKMAILPSLVERKEVFMANSLISITGMLAAVLGFGLGGIIVERLGLKVAFLIDALTFFTSAFFIFFMKIKSQPNISFSRIIELGREVMKKAENSFFFDIKQGINYLRKETETKFAFCTLFVLFSCLGALYVVFIVFIQNTLSSVTLELGKLAVGAGGGLFLGSLLYGRLAHHIPVKKVVNAGMFFASSYLLFFIVFLRLSPSPNFAFFSCFILGIICAPMIIAINGLLHTKSKNEFWGRIFSSLEMVIHFAFLIFMFITSYLAEFFTPFTVIFCVGIIVFLFSFFNLLREK